MEKLLDIGFEQAGHWTFERGDLHFELNKFATRNNVLYAFVVNNDVKYVGKTIKTLTQRMRWYKKPSQTQITNVRNNLNILECLQSGHVVDIYVLPDSGLMKYGVFHLNLAAGLEDSIIKIMRPEWNGGRKEIVLLEDDREQAVVDLLPVISEFKLILQKTYYAQGFFNVPVDKADLCASDGEKIEIYLNDSEAPIVGVINRKANNNGTPRIMGTVRLRDWFMNNYKMMDEVHVSILSQFAIRLH